MGKSNTDKRRAKPASSARESKVQFVPLGKMTVSGRIQRDLRPARVSYLVANLELADLGLPVLNFRNGEYFIIDGQHRIAALKQFLGDNWEVQKIECRVFEGLTEQEEADMFDRLSDVLPVSAFDRFKTRVTAKREVESKIATIVASENLVISQDKVPGAIGAVSTLVRVYTRSDGDTLGKTLRIIRDSFGDSGFESPVIDGLGLLCQRYNGVLEEEHVVERLAVTHGGVKGLLGKAAMIHEQTGNPRALCVAVAAVDIINTKRGKKIPSWWKMEEEERAAKERVERYREEVQKGASAH